MVEGHTTPRAERLALFSVQDDRCLFSLEAAQPSMTDPSLDDACAAEERLRRDGRPVGGY